MKPYSAMFCGVILLIATISASAQQSVRHGLTGHVSIINGERYPITLVDETFTGQPIFTPASKSSPPLDIITAYQLAYDQFLQLQEPAITYEVTDITLNRFHRTDWWYYVVGFTASKGWEMVEPYRSLTQAGKWNRETPQIQIVVLMTGKVITPKQSGAPVGDP